MTHDPFPRERVAAMVRRMPAYLRLSWRLGKDPLLSKARRAAVIGAAGYLASPVDLVPGVIPVLGQLDDIAVALAAPPARARRPGPGATPRPPRGRRPGGRPSRRGPADRRRHHRVDRAGRLPDDEEGRGRRRSCRGRGREDDACGGGQGNAGGEGRGREGSPSRTGGRRQGGTGHQRGSTGRPCRWRIVRRRP